MVTFKKMWDDVQDLLSRGIFNVEEKFSNSFVIKDKDGKRVFIAKEDFIDIWCRILYYKEVSKDCRELFGNPSQLFIYDILSRLPYISESGDSLKLTA